MYLSCILPWFCMCKINVWISIGLWYSSVYYTFYKIFFGLLISVLFSVLYPLCSFFLQVIISHILFSNRVKTKTSAKYGLESQPRLVDIIAAVPQQYRRALVPKLKAKPIRTASGVCSPHSLDFIFTGIWDFILNAEWLYPVKIICQLSKEWSKFRLLDEIICL